MNNTAICPTCGTPISEIKRREIERNEKRRQAQMEAAIREAYLQKLEAAKALAQKQAIAQADKRVVAVAAERDKVLKRVKEMEGREAAVRKQAQEDAERRVKQFQTLSAQRLQKELAEQRQVLDKHRDHELLKQRAGFNREREALEKKCKDIERRLQRQSANELGDGAEIDAFDVLREAFSDDRITRVPKGQRGGDIIQEVIHRGKSCGKILIDSKNRQGWQNTFVAKLREDQESAKADYAILATTVFPSGQKDFCVQDGVIVINPVRMVYMVSLLRGFMIRLHQLSLSTEERAGKMSVLYEFITSEGFRQDLDTASRLTRDILDLDVDEQKEHQKVWKQRGLLATRLTRVITDVDTNICAILEGPHRGKLRSVASQHS